MSIHHDAQDFQSGRSVTADDRLSHAPNGIKSKKKDGIDEHKFEYNAKI